MTDTTTRTDTAQYGVAALLAAVGAYTVYDATTLNVGFGDPVGPRAFPYVIGIVLVGLAVLLALATARGDAVLRRVGAGGRVGHSRSSSFRVSSTRASCSSRYAVNSSPVVNASIHPLSSSACCQPSLSCISSR